MQAHLAVDNSALRSEFEAALQQCGWEVISSAPAPLMVVVQESLRETADLCRALRAREDSTNAYLLAGVPAAARDDLSTLIQAGVDEFVALPLEAEELGGRLELAAQRIRRTHPSQTTELREQVARLEWSLGVRKVLLDELFESAPEGIAVLDGDDRVIRTNSEFCRMFGYTQEEVAGELINDLIAPEPRFHEAFDLTLRTLQGETVAVETVRRRKDGSEVEVSLLARPVRIGGGLIGAYAIYRDIGERKQALKALKESEQRYHALFDQSPIGIFLCDRSGRITHCNDQLLHILHAEREQVVGLNLIELPDPRVHPVIQDALETPSRSSPIRYDGPYRSASSGVELWVSIRISPLRADGVSGWIGILEDTTEREEAKERLHAQAVELERVNEELRRRTAQLEAAMQTRTRLYARMNHELRTPISAIMLYNELLLSETLGSLSEDQRRGIERAQQSAEHLLELVQDMLDLSKIEAGKLSIQPVAVYLPELLDQLLSTIQPLAGSRGSEVRMERCGRHATVVTDPRRLRQILLNLAANAVKFGRGRPITVRCADGPDGGVVMEVVDQGIGIAAENLPLIFEDFVQLGGESRGEGTGLGLAIARRLAELLGGRLEVESVLGEGSTFRLILPDAVDASAPSAKMHKLFS